MNSGGRGRWVEERASEAGLAGMLLFIMFLFSFVFLFFNVSSSFFFSFFGWRQDGGAGPFGRVSIITHEVSSPIP